MAFSKKRVSADEMKARRKKYKELPWTQQMAEPRPLDYVSHPDAGSDGNYHLSRRDDDEEFDPGEFEIGDVPRPLRF